MMQTPRTAWRGDCSRPTDSKLVSDPLNFLIEEHLRHRQICAFLTVNAQSPRPDFETMALALAFLRHEFLLHDADERSSLYPLMRKRCEAEDEIDLLITRLLTDHDEALEATRMICAILESALEGKAAFDEEERQQLLAFADKMKRYITLENAIILPLARARLTEEDTAHLARAMLLRRGIVIDDDRSGQSGGEDAPSPVGGLADGVTSGGHHDDN